MTRPVPYYIGRTGWRGARQAALARDGFRCRYCGVMTYCGVNQSVDHVIPASMGGRYILVNLVTACHSCNKRKGSRSLKDVGMKLLPRPEFDHETIRAWETVARRKCCIHCGHSLKSHYRDKTKPHGYQRRCRDTGRRFYPRDAYLIHRETGYEYAD